MSQKQILLIDDESDIQMLAKMGLTMTTDWSVLSANSGKEGVAIATSTPPDAILLDVMMPEMDGPATLIKLRTNPKTQNIPIIFLTAKAQAKDRRDLYAAGADGIITKPFDPTTLASQISEFLGW